MYFQTVSDSFLPFIQFDQLLGDHCWFLAASQLSQLADLEPHLDFIKITLVCLIEWFMIMMMAEIENVWIAGGGG